MGRERNNILRMVKSPYMSVPGIYVYIMEAVVTNKSTQIGGNVPNTKPLIIFLPMPVEVLIWFHAGGVNPLAAGRLLVQLAAQRNQTTFAPVQLLTIEPEREIRRIEYFTVVAIWSAYGGGAEYWWYPQHVMNWMRPMGEYSGYA